ncbi:hypothetical protein KEM55_006660 [Ascosphaera atra]|nr:hypothetical protein KEM55_006660 [Ascosphaera atra]
MDRSLNLSSGLIFANPVPEGSDLRKEEMDVIINKALEEARRAEVLGSDNTPFVLAKIKELSNGRSVKANTALVEANALRGARVAVELARLEKGEEGLLR